MLVVYYKDYLGCNMNNSYQFGNLDLLLATFLSLHRCIFLSCLMHIEMKREIARYVSECVVCQRVKASHLKVAGTL